MKEHINEIYKGMRPWIVGDKRLTQKEMFDALERVNNNRYDGPIGI